MSEAIFLYTLILLGCIATTALTPKSIYGIHSQNIGIKYYLYTFIPILIYTLFWGLRYDVGTDYPGYVGYFSYMPEEIEIGYKTLNDILKGLGFNYVSVFIITSFFPIFTLFLISRKESKQFAILLIYFFFTTSFIFFTQNGIRQSIALFFIFILISKIKDSKLPILIISAILAWSFHKSAIIPIVFIAILYILKPLKINKYILIALLVILSFTGSKLYDLFFAKFAFLFELLDYSGYEERMSDFEKTVEFGSGLGMILKLILNSTVIFFQDKLLSDNKKSPVYFFYLFFLLGIILEPIIAENNIMKRMNVYFINMRFIVYAYLCTYLLKNKRQAATSKIIASIFIIALFLLYLASILSNSNDCVPYKSIFSTVI